MDETFERLRSLFARTEGLDPGARQRLLDAECANEPELRQQLEVLLSHHDEDHDVLGSPAPTHPSQVGRYRLLEVVGSGGIGVVYRAEQDRPRRIVALKLIQPGAVRPETLRRFGREAEYLGRFAHPGIAQVFDAGTFEANHGDQAYIAMEFVDGEPITHFARRHGLSVSDRIDLITQCCDAAQHAHDRGVLHRDLKPANLLITQIADARPCVKVLDFGIARATEDEAGSGDSLLTSTGQLLGTLPYMSPEQLDGRPVDGKSDVYALGAVLYEILCGRVPLELDGLPLTEALRVVMHESPRELGQIDSALRGDLSIIAMKALAKDPHRRYSNPAELAADLHRFANKRPILARRPSIAYEVRTFARRNRGTVVALFSIFAIMLAAIVTVSIFAKQNQNLAKKEHDARSEERRSRYVAEMNLAGEALEDGSIARVRELVEPWSTTDESGIDPRGFEWHLLAASCHNEQCVVDTNEVEHDVAWVDADHVLSHESTGGVLWSLTTKNAVRRYPGHSNDFVRVRLSPDKRLVAVTWNDTLRIYERESGDLRTTLNDVGTTRCIVWMPGRGVIAYSCTDGTVHVREIESGTGIARFSGNYEKLAFSRHGHLACASLDGTIEIRNTTDWSVEQKLDARTHVFVLGFSHDGARLAVVGNPGCTIVWDNASGRELRRIEQGGQLLSLAWHPDCKRLATGGRDQVIRIIDVEANRVTSLRGHANTVWGLDFSPITSASASASGDSTLASAGEDGTIRTWEPDDVAATAITRIRLPVAARNETYGMRMAWGPDDAIAVSLPAVGEAFVIRGGSVVERSGRERQWSRDFDVEACMHEDSIEIRHGTRSERVTPPTGSGVFSHDNGGLVLSRDGSRVAFSTRGEHVSQVWVSRPFTETTPICVVHGWTPAFAWRPDGDILAVSTVSAVRGIRAHDASTLFELPIRRPTVLAWNGDGLRLAIADYRMSIHLWNTQNETAIRELRGHTMLIRGLDWHPDGSRIASVGNDRTVRIWDTLSGLQMLQLRLTGKGFAVRWHADGKRLVVASDDGVVTVYDASRTR
ncbi:MAG: protein kinase [Planctomycetes bacterium]|nr:protein kinase [Planctomycetota bacterium]